MPATVKLGGDIAFSVEREGRDSVCIVSRIACTRVFAFGIGVDPKSHNVYLFQPERGPAPAPPPAHRLTDEDAVVDRKARSSRVGSIVIKQ